MRSRSGFTIVELLVVITVIVVLTGVAIVTFKEVRRESRDATRSSNATIISEALEKYYEKNGEYPSVASIVNDNASNTGDTVAAKLAVPGKSLVMPKVPPPATNSITSGPEPHDDYIVYVGVSADDNARCQDDVNGGCDRFTLTYIEESGETKVIESRRGPRVVATVTKPDLTVVSTSISTIDASWTSVSGATSYTLERSLSSDMSSPVETNPATTSESATGLLASTTYYFRVRAIIGGSQGEWSDIQSATTNGIGAPTGTLTITASMSGTDAVGTGGGGSCTGGSTIQRQIRYSSTATSTAGTWSSYTGGSPRSVAASQGWQYTFQQQARCTGPGGNSGWVSSGTASVVRPITSAPTAPTVSVTFASGDSNWNWGAASCFTGTAAEYQVRRLNNETGYDSGWSAPRTSRTWTWSNTEGYSYSLQVQARCETIYSTGPWSATGQRTQIAPVLPPAAPTSFVYYLRPDRMFDSWSWTAPSCGSGKRADFYQNSYLSGAGWYWVATGQEGWRYGTDGWSPLTNAAPYYGTNNESPYPWGNQVKVQHKAKYVCVHLATGRVSASGPVGISALVTVP